MDLLKIKRGDGVVTVAKSDYIAAKTKQLREFGYDDLTEHNVAEELAKVIAGTGTGIIARFIEGDLPA